MDAWLEELELNLSYLSIYRHPTAEPRCTPAGGRGWGEVGLIVQSIFFSMFWVEMNFRYSEVVRATQCSGILNNPTGAG